MNNIIKLFENQNKQVLDFTHKINYIYQIEKQIINKVKEEKYNNTCFILNIKDLDDVIKNHIYEKYELKEINDKDDFILFYKTKFIYSFYEHEEITENYIIKFIYYADYEARKDNAKLIISCP